MILVSPSPLFILKSSISVKNVVDVYLFVLFFSPFKTVYDALLFILRLFISSIVVFYVILFVLRPSFLLSCYFGGVFFVHVKVFNPF